MQKTSKHIIESIAEFAKGFQPLEPQDGLLPFTDKRTNATFCECHVKAKVLAALATTDGPLDPDGQSEYRANRDIRLNHPAFERMKKDAEHGRAFSNIVAEYTKEYMPDKPLKIVGGQHRFQAIQYALKYNVDEYHGIKVYFNLDKAQRMDVQLISNTTIAVSSALFDRMDETAKGPSLREWCQKTGVLPAEHDFSDLHARGAISVRLVRSFITNYLNGRAIDAAAFEKTETTPILCPSGDHDEAWDKLVETSPGIWEDEGLLEAGREFALLVKAQRSHFGGLKKVKPDHPDKALNIAVVASWAFVAGILEPNRVRAQRHFALRKAVGSDPLNAESLAKGRFKSDAPNYRGLGNRTDAKERGRLVELFYMQAESGLGISLSMIQNAIRKYEMKVLSLEIDADH
jgi:hypothetical protein